MLPTATTILDLLAAQAAVRRHEAAILSPERAPLTYSACMRRRHCAPRAALAIALYVAASLASAQGAATHRLARAGHLPQVENPAEVAPIYVAFLRRAAGAAPQPKPQATTRRIEATFACDGGKRIDAVFENGPPNSVSLALSDGRRISLPQAMSASGARYANGNESFVFWNKGDTAFIEESGQTTYSGCTTKSLK